MRISDWSSDVCSSDLSYIAVIFVALPLMILTGLAMSPGMNAAWPWLVDLFGGRQSARSIHFIAAFALAAFFLVPMLMVLPIGSASCRARVCQYVSIPVVAVSLKNKTKNILATR